MHGRDGFYTRDEKCSIFAATLSIDGDSADVFNGFTTVGEAELVRTLRLRWFSPKRMHKLK